MAGVRLPVSSPNALALLTIAATASYPSKGITFMRNDGRAFRFWYVLGGRRFLLARCWLNRTNVQQPLQVPQELQDEAESQETGLDKGLPPRQGQRAQGVSVYSDIGVAALD